MTDYRDRLGRVPADYNHRPDILAEEIARVFEPSWICVGLTDDLANHNDFVTAEIGHRGIVVQNARGNLNAFRNVCSHRFSRIQCARSGNRPLLCPYHGWSYDQDGKPDGIPHNAKSFGLTEADRQDLSLERYALDTCGRFVFVRMAKEGPSLREFLGGCYDALEHLSGVCPDKFESVSLEWDANWKIGMDNAAEGYHVPLVHAESFALILMPDLEIARDAEHSTYRGKLTERSQKWWDKVERSIDLKPSPLYPGYANFLIFPNIVVTLSHGAFLTFQTIEPIDAGRLRINSTAWLAANRGGGARDLIVDSLKAFSHQVREEDRAICAQAQRGVRDRSDGRAGLLGEMEGRIAHFQAAYARRMGL
ncbi:MAG TPA: aromatic ring-hydroxylating dioxygenase subunit alpha [Stellaceae bacterium]|nr:aromatic ring-hydroxylating dioxygenase subunit alpha [Stellaceae bacterium]